MAKRNGTEGNGMFLEPVALVQGTILSQLLWIIMSVVLATIVYFSTWQASPGLLAFLAHVAGLVGGIFAGWRCKKRAWLHGVVLGIAVYALFSYIGYGELPFVTWPWWKGLLKMALVAMIGGIVGGLFGA